MFSFASGGPDEPDEAASELLASSHARPHSDTEYTTTTSHQHTHASLLDSAQSIDPASLKAGQDFSKAISTGGAKLTGSSSAGSGAGAAKAQAMAKAAARINLEQVATGHRDRGPRHTGRDDRATVEQVLDPRTQLILFKLVAQGTLSSIHGCVSTGKEANVYHAFGDAGQDIAIKVYKTSILVFKDRDRYVSGEYRFKNGYSKRNPRKMVKVWAEKEMRNLRRLATAGLPAPEALLVRQNVLVMSFIGHDGEAAPRLKDAMKSLSHSKRSSAYSQVVLIMRRMYQVCRLVHADMSEYNLLWHDGKVYIIDVSQSVEPEHPRALDFLRTDIVNVTAYFRRQGLATMREDKLLEFVLRTDLPSEEAEQAALEQAASQATAVGSSNTEVSAFLSATLVQNLGEVLDLDKFERQQADDGLSAMVASLMHGVSASPAEDDADLVAAQLAGAAAAAAAAAAPAGDAAAHEAGSAAHDEDDEDDDSRDDDGESDGEGEDDDDGTGDFRRKDASKEERRAHRAAVKAAARERRQHKVKKHTKKRAMKANKKK